jgi:hypothetical protein
MQTLNLGHIFNDADLEGVILGVVYSAAHPIKSDPKPNSNSESENKEGGKEKQVDNGELKVKIKSRILPVPEGVRGGHGPETVDFKEELRVKGGEAIKKLEVVQRMRDECLDRAVGNVERSTLMEGVMDIEPDEMGTGGRASFLVYRID